MVRNPIQALPSVQVPDCIVWSTARNMFAHVLSVVGRALQAVNLSMLAPYKTLTYVRTLLIYTVAFLWTVFYVREVGPGGRWQELCEFRSLSIRFDRIAAPSNVSHRISSVQHISSTFTTFTNHRFECKRRKFK